ncbi:MAG: YfcE family phosphodiesterase [Candidatus Nanohalobium sp.]
MIAVVSDSHVPTRADKIPKQFREKMKESDLIVHAGDFDEKPVKNGIDEYGELVAVRGNCDFFDLPNSETFERNGVKFGVYHGTGINPRGDHDTLQKIATEDLEVDILITGHTHEEEITELEECVILNPGSCTGVGGGSSRRGNPTMLDIGTSEDASIQVNLIEIREGEMTIRRTEEYSQKS